MPRPPSDWITLADAAAVLAAAGVAVTPGTVGRWAREGRLERIRPGGTVYVRRGQVRSLLRPRRRVRGEALQTPLFEGWDG
ncbi:MAG: hypothetical protein EPN50_04670 [Chloroflexota bacterium]|nr:MAG: hypothetical protein EPN50_04670 [Chloroflexota bacterium]